jgi:hypothetical protein
MMNANTLKKAVCIISGVSIKLFIEVPMWIAGWIVFPFAYPFRYTLPDLSDRQGTIAHFPWWARPWDNKDHGIDGQGFYAEKTVGWPYWLRCLIWSCNRNGSFNWSKYVMGIKARPYTHEGDVAIGDKKAGGSYWCFMPGTLFFEYYSIIPYTLFGKKRCIRIRLGWKRYGKPDGELCQFCGVFNPLMPYLGE